MSLRTTLCLSAMVWFLIGAEPSQACSLCGCGDPLAAAGETPPMANQWSVRLDGEVLTARARSDDDPALTEGVTQTTVAPGLVWSPAESLSLVAQVPFARKAFTVTSNDGSSGETVTLAGLGDVQVGVRWFAWRDVNMVTRTAQSVALTVGATLPTGADNANDDAGNRIDQHAQLGTGAFGPAAGLQWARHGDTWGVLGSATGVTHTKNSTGYQFGSAVRWSLRADTTPTDRWVLALGCEGRYAAHDVADGESQANTGGTVVALVPAAWYRVAPGAWLTAAVHAPVFTRLFGDQHLGPTFAMTVQYTPAMAQSAVR